ncbi:AzlC family protein [Ferroglobus placidus DSM 10642]|uniref:AzlC family protein n=1 Tax=Ferroglobus placidus (strain DSM 10642 / AEDII12DO) TaxID=589924 RepID=D3RWP7_FERPA|nr:AzlC family ABC transporter permease [Ferroglobus placidus]ADC64910.1 AzlC family protein [Ferroglobus placidus DSM 10642]
MRSLKDSLPIVVSYFSISTAFGMIAKEYLGFNAVLMSALVFAGAAQFIALQMIANKSPSALIVLTTFLVNSRHLLMSSYLSRFYIGVSKRIKAVVSFGITDETFAVASKRFQEGKANPSYNLQLNFFSYSAWVSGTALGIFFGAILPEDVSRVLPFGLTALFISILVSSVKEKSDLIAALTAGIFAVVLPSGWNIVVASLVGCFAGGVAEKWMSRS